MTYNLNTQSGYLHREDHGGSENVESFDRIDAADLFAHRSGLELKHCSVCFKDAPPEPVIRPEVVLTSDGDEDPDEDDE
jgi:hypothetical protein